MPYLNSNEPYERLKQPSAWIGAGVGAATGLTAAHLALLYGKKRFPQFTLSGRFKAFQYINMGIGGLGIGATIGGHMGD